MKERKMQEWTGKCEKRNTASFLKYRMFMSLFTNHNTNGAYTATSDIFLPSTFHGAALWSPAFSVAPLMWSLVIRYQIHVYR